MILILNSSMHVCAACRNAKRVCCWVSKLPSYDVPALSTPEPSLTFLSLSLSTLIIHSFDQHHSNSPFCSIYDNRVALFDRGDSVGNWSSYRSSLRCMWRCVSGSRQITFSAYCTACEKCLTILCLLRRYLMMSGWGLMASSDDQSGTFCILLLSIYLVCSWFISNVKRAATQATSLVRTWVTAWASYIRLTVTGRAMFTLKTPQC